jgi:tetratricopeptide (TPR) repeat protein
MEMGEEQDAFVIYEEMMGMPGLSSADLFAIGVGYYQGSDYAGAVQAFSQAAETSVNDRDAIEMWARSLQLDSLYAEVPPVAERWIELDPNSQNAYLILAQSQNQLGDQAATQQAVRSVEALEAAVNDLTLRRFAGGGGSVTGSVINKTLSQGAQVTLTFTFYDDAGTSIGTVTESVTVGAADMAQVFQIEFDSAQQVGGYGYTLTTG